MPAGQSKLSADQQQAKDDHEKAKAKSAKAKAKGKSTPIAGSLTPNFKQALGGSKRKSDPNDLQGARAQQRNRGRTPLILATELGQHECMRLLARRPGPSTVAASACRGDKHHDLYTKGLEPNLGRFYKCLYKHITHTVFCFFYVFIFFFNYSI